MAAPSSGDIHPPPYRLVSDMVVVFGLCPTGPVRDSFPHLRLAALGDRAVLATWFAHVHDVRSGASSDGRAAGADESRAVPYRELTVGILLRGRRWFVPEIYATGETTIAVGRDLGMPKRPASMTYDERGPNVVSQLRLADGEARIVGRRIGAGLALAWSMSRLLPRRSPPVLFPSGTDIRARVEAVEGVRPVWLREARLDLRTPWLPRPASPLPVAIHLAGLRMVLPDGDLGRR